MEIDSNKLIRTLINKTWAYKVYSKCLITLKRRLNWVSLQRVMNFQHARKTLVEGSIIEALLHTRALLYTVNIKFSKSNTIFKTFWTTQRFGFSGMIEIQEEKFVVAFILLISYWPVCHERWISAINVLFWAAVNVNVS